MEFMNDLLEREAPSMKNFLQLISVSNDESPPSFLDIYFPIRIRFIVIKITLNNIYRAPCQRMPRPITL